MNTYVDLGTFKSRAGINGASWDSDLLSLLEHLSRAADNFCNRWFYVSVQTRRFNGSASPLFLDADLLSVSALRTDDDADGSYEATWDPSDFVLLPANQEAKSAIAATPWGRYSRFAGHGQPLGVEITGLWGFGQELAATGGTVNGSHGAGATSLAVSSGAGFAPGQTLQVGSEQIFVSAVVSNTLTVVRGVNGTAAAALSGGEAISRYRYPRPVVEAVIVQAARRWSARGGRDPSFAPSRPFPAAADASPMPLELEPDVRAMLVPYRRIPIAGA